MKKIALILLLSSFWAAEAQEVKEKLDSLKQQLINTSEAQSVSSPTYWNINRASLDRFGSVGVSTIQTFDNRYEGVKGSPLLFDDWKKGAIILEGDEKAYKVDLNFDCQNNQILFRDQEGKTQAFRSEFIRSFLISDETAPDKAWFFVKDNLSRKKEPLFLQVVYNGKTRLYQHLRKELKRADYQRAYSPDRRYDEFVWVNQLFLVKPDGTTEKIALNKRSVLSALSDKSNEISHFISKNGLKLEKVDELAAILAYYDTLP
ncbi:MAG TPA: hypothetical protein PK167_03575 [Prolixibacteraceae bacterium]|nr:hypothetical protein [Prolixibacteraceae bacterium]